MTINRGEQEPKPQATEDAKKSAISDCLKKCASWFGVASDVYKRKVKAIKPQKSDGTPNALYQSLVQKFNLNSFDYKNGIVILPNSYKKFYADQGWEDGIFESDLQEVVGGFTGGNQGNHAQSNQGNQGSNNNGNRNSNKRNSGGSNKPQEFRIQALSAPRTNQDGTSIFDALLESKNNCVVIVPKELTNDAVNMIAPKFVVRVKGWLNENKGTLKVAKNGNIELDQQRQNAS